MANFYANNHQCATSQEEPQIPADIDGAALHLLGDAGGGREEPRGVPGYQPHCGGSAGAEPERRR